MMTRPGTNVPIITQPGDDMDWKRVPAAPAKQPPTPATTPTPPPKPSPSAGPTKENEANDDDDVETMHTDHPTDDRKPTASKPRIDSAADPLECNDEEDNEKDDEEDCDATEHAAHAI